jgi:hypothetical protein
VKENVDEQLLRLFNSYEDQDSFIDGHVYIFADDGRVITMFGREKDDIDVHSTGALMAGAWQASIALNGTKGLSEDQTLMLGDTKSGFLIIPFNGTMKMNLGVVYNNYTNPGKLKMKTRLLRDFFSNNIKLEIKEKISKQNYLFKNITDAELDKLFSFAGI